MAQSVNQLRKLNKSQNILVAVRVRPLNREEGEKKLKNVINCVSHREVQFKDKKYRFDRVFNCNSSQSDVYQFAVASMITDVLAGYNCTIFAYGQTGSGKTHTMVGDDAELTSNQSWKEYKMAGCIPRAAANIFEELAMLKVSDYSVSVSFLELYNEEVKDLLNADAAPSAVHIFNDTRGNVFIQNLRTVPVVSSVNIFNLLKEGLLKRQTAATLMNNHSSRSHVVFTITVHTREMTSNGEEVLKTGKLNLVDLAGSENIAKSGAKDKRAQESANINKSLLTLGRVIQILAEKNSKHVPYRDSKLTRILQDSLGGHTKTCIVATISPSHASLEETQNTLEYASRARDVKNTPMINEKITKSQMIKELSCEIERLKKDLQAARLQQGIFVDPENWKEINSRLETNSQALNMKTDTILCLRDKISELESIREFKEKQYDEIMYQCKYKEKLIKKATDSLKDHRISLRQEQYLSRCYAEAANEKDAKVSELLNITKDYSRCLEVLQQKLENQYFNNMCNEKLINEKSEVLSNNSNLASTKLDHLRDGALEILDMQHSEIDSAKSNCRNYESNLKMFAENRQRKIMESIFEELSAPLMQQSLQFANEIATEMRINFSIIETYEQQLNNISEKLLNRKRRKEQFLRELNLATQETKLDILDDNDMLNLIDNVKRFCRDQVNFRAEIDDVNSRQLDLSASTENRKHHAELNLEYLEQQRTTLLKDTHTKIVDGIEGQLLNEKRVKELDFIQDQQQRLRSLQDKTGKLRAHIETNELEMNSILMNIDDIGKSMSTELTKFQRVGDTPNRRRFSFTPYCTNGTLPRDTLINRFKEEFSEDIGNESLGLNVSIDLNDTSTEEEIPESSKDDNSPS